MIKNLSRIQGSLLNENKVNFIRKSFPIERILRYSANALVLLFLCVFFFQPIETEDSWYHLAVGRWIVHNAAVPKVNIFPFSAEQVPWIFSSWLGSSIYYVIFAAFGIFGLKIFRMILFVSILALFYKYAIKKIPHSFLIALIIALAYGLAGRLLLRPLVFNFFFLQIFLSVLFANQRNNHKYLWIIPVSTVLWVNLHLGCFVYGLPVLLIFWGSNIVSWINLKLEENSSKEDIAQLSERIQNLFLVILGYFAAYLINPYGIIGAIYPLRAIISPTYIDRAFFFNSTSETQPPGFILGWEGTWFYFMTAMATVLLICNKRDQLLQWILFTSGFFFFLYGARGSEFFLIVTAYVIAECSVNIDLMNKWAEYSKKFLGIWVHYIILISILTLMSFRWITREIIIEDQSKRFISLKYQPYNAVRAVQFLKEHNIKGRIFNWKMYGGYILWDGYPDLRPFVDSRDIDLKLQHDYANVNSAPGKYWPDLDQKYKFDIIMIEADASFQYKFLDYINENPDWKFVFLDGSCIVFMRLENVKLLGSAANLSEKLRLMNYDPSSIVSQSLALKQRDFSRIWTPAPTYNNLFEEGVALYAMRYYGAAMTKLENALKFDHSNQVQFAYDAFTEELRKNSNR